MKKSFLLNIPAVCVLALLAGCHKKADKPVAVRHIDFVLTPDAAAKTIALQCNASSSGKCGFAFETGTPGEVLLDAGGSATIAGVTAGGQYCYGLAQLDIASCHKRPLPVAKTAVNRDLQSTPAPVPAN